LELPAGQVMQHGSHSAKKREFREQSANRNYPGVAGLSWVTAPTARQASNLPTGLTWCHTELLRSWCDGLLPDKNQHRRGVSRSYMVLVLNSDANAHYKRKQLNYHSLQTQVTCGRPSASTCREPTPGPKNLISGAATDPTNRRGDYTLTAAIAVMTPPERNRRTPIGPNKLLFGILRMGCADDRVMQRA
jgi:hypothetical protein